MVTERSRHQSASGLKTALRFLAFSLFVFGCCGAARAGLTIDPIFDSSITTSASAAAIEASIDADITTIDSYIANPITVTIEFTGTNTGLGQSQSFRDDISYSQYLSDLSTQQTLSTSDTLAISTLPAGPNNPVNSGTSMNLSDPLLRALGESIGNNPPSDSNPQGLDSTISLNLSLMNLSRTGSQNPDDYDLQSVAMHEIDEVLGIGGAGSTLQLTGSYTGQAAPTGDIGALDLYRYSAPGTRSFSLDPNVAQPYFSITGGTTRLVYFNQNGAGGSDFADWGAGVAGAAYGNTPPQVQDAFGNPGTQQNLASNELTALDIIGWNLTPAGMAVEQAVPEPATMGLLGAGIVALVAYRKRSRSAV